MRQFGVRSIVWALVLCSLYEETVEAFQLSAPDYRGTAHLQASSLSKNNKARSSSSLGAEATNEETSQVNGSAIGGGLTSIGSALQSQLVSAFTSLDESDQYDAVLTGLCAKILDNPSKSGDQVTVALQDPIQLLQEMNSRRIPASARSLMALIDVRLFFFMEGIGCSDLYLVFLTFCVLSDYAGYSHITRCKNHESNYFSRSQKWRNISVW
jgi:hypothetical protein